MAVTADAPVSKVEGIKFTSDHLRGTIAEELAGDAPAFSSDSYELLKFHGIYQQDDRDVRAERQQPALCQRGLRPTGSTAGSAIRTRPGNAVRSRTSTGSGAGGSPAAHAST